MDRIIAYCGLVCSECGAYQATQANDPQALERVAAEWREEYNAPGITAAYAVCDGCLGEGRHCGHCSECDIRACGVRHGVANCAHCEDYPCARLASFLDAVPIAKATLDEVHRSL